MEAKMNLLKKIFSGAPARSSSSFYSFTVQCDRCDETIDGRINLANDLSADYDGDRVVYHVRKVLMGSGSCFQQIEVAFHFDSSRKLIDRQIAGGRFVEES
jgi:hypothetical protein